MFSVQRILYFYLELSNCFDEIYVPLEINRVHTRSSYQKLNVPDRKLNVGQKGISCCWSLTLEFPSQFKQDVTNFN